MKSAKDYYNFWVTPYTSHIPWDELDKEVQEYWESHWQAIQERRERMRGNSPD